MQENKIKIIITDDHRIFRRGVIQSLAPKKDIEIIAEAEHGLDLLEKLEYLKPDMITLGLRMPIMDGLVTLPKLKQKYPAIKVIILTMYEDPAFVRRTIELGANAYFLKSAEPEEIYAGMLYLRNNWLYITELVANSLHQSEGKYLKNGNQFLGARELQILKLLSAGKSVNEIASEIDLREETVLALVSRIKENREPIISRKTLC